MRLRLIAQALLFALIVTGPELFELLRFDGLSPKSFSDWDEPYYLPIAYARGNELLAWWNGTSTHQGNYLRYLFFIAPQEVIASLIGLAASLAGMKATVLAAALDIIVTFLSYLAFLSFFRVLGFRESRATAATIVTLFFPWLLYIPQLLHIPLPFGPEVASIPHGMYPCPPILRGLNTQLSYPVFGLALVTGVLGAIGSRKALAASGILSGILVYFYFFAWPAAIALIFFLLILSNKPARGIAADLGWYLFPALLASIPALVALFQGLANSVQDAGVVSSVPKINDALWYFNAEQFLLLAALTIWMLRQRKHFAVRLCVAALLAEFALMNSQKILGVHIAPYHFPLLYLHPVLSGTLFVSILGCIRNIELRSMPTMLLGASMMLIQVNQLKGNFAVSNDTREFISLSQTISKETPKGARIMFPPSNSDSKSGKNTYHYFTIPYWIQALTERPLYANFVGSTPQGTMAQNLLSGFVYSGELGPYVPCPDAPPVLPGDIMSGMMTREYWARYHTCLTIPAYLKEHSLCRIFETAPIDFVVWQHTVTKTVPPQSLRYLEPLWRSEGGEYELFRFNKPLFNSDNCTPAPQDATSTAAP